MKNKQEKKTKRMKNKQEKKTNKQTKNHQKERFEHDLDSRSSNDICHHRNECLKALMESNVHSKQSKLDLEMELELEYLSAIVQHGLGVGTVRYLLQSCIGTKQPPPPIALAKVDANEEENRGLATEFHIHGFPTINILRNGGKNIQEYKGPREADSIVDYLKKQAGAAFTKNKSIEDVGSLINEKNIFVAMLFVNFSKELDSFQSTYKDVAKQSKGKDISFLLGDLEASEGAFQEVLSAYKWADMGQLAKPNGRTQSFTVTTMVDAGDLSLAYAMAYMGW
ncbi:Protein disulfide-isomerase [Abeliophyllum distichum]|uniref:protein disulfide-isomerase n=1 Tax=Abeliophyllum distichum TaxID=126358 RepID=A0ABD1REL8_9LAMI